jgi:hypothetical protein
MSFGIGPSPSLVWHMRQALTWCGCSLALFALVGCSHTPPSGVVHQQSTEPGALVWHSMLRQKIDPNLGPYSRIRFSLVVEQPLMTADVARQDREDSPARVILAFDGDRSEFSARESALSELSHLMTGEPMPYATLMYVWCPKREVGSVVHNPRVDRIRKVVVAGPSGGQSHHLIDRDIRADYEKAFGRPPGRLIGIAIMTDSDNTQGRARALYGPIEMW